MKRSPFILCALLLAACPGPKTNPAEVWLAPNGSELFVQLVDQEPEPF